MSASMPPADSPRSDKSATAAASPPAPKPAATVILVRAAPEGGDYQVCMMRRHHKSAFMGGAFVFPGGKVDPSDGALDEGLLRRPEAANSTEDRAGRIAACREAFEEVGALLAESVDGDAGAGAGAGATMAAMQSGSDLSAWRERVQREPDTWPQYLREHRLVLDLAQLHPWTHWITPSAEPRRYDTLFYVALLPAGQKLKADAVEATEQRWWTPDEAIALADAGDILLPPPTRRSLDELPLVAPDFPALQAVLASRTQHEAPVLPKHTILDGQHCILLPGDPDYAQAMGEGAGSMLAAADVHDAPDGAVGSLAAVQAQLPTRFVF